MDGCSGLGGIFSFLVFVLALLSLPYLLRYCSVNCNMLVILLENIVSRYEVFYVNAPFDRLSATPLLLRYTVISVKSSEN